jgi:hypothetical protein
VNKLVLYREVKAEDRLPSKGRYYYTNAGVLRFQLYHGTWHQQPKNSTIGHWLEPIEITEEWIRDNFSAVWYNDLDGVTGLEEAITDLLSKLTGDE